MGHFGRHAIRVDWFALVMPALVLNYLGQGALVLSHPEAAANPFFLLFPGWLLLPVVLLTTAATVIASQAVISGAFALVQQAIQLGALPRLEVRQTSDEVGGAGLRAADQLAAGRRRAGAGVRLPQLGRAGQRLRHRGRGRHAGHHGAGYHRRLGRVALARRARAAGGVPVPRARRHLRLRQRAQDPRRRLVPAAGRRHRADADAELAPRPRRRVCQARRRLAAARQRSSPGSASLARRCAGRAPRSISPSSGRTCRRAGAQPEAQRRAARPRGAAARW